jgi:hypothetical protein
LLIRASTRVQHLRRRARINGLLHRQATDGTGPDPENPLPVMAIRQAGASIFSSKPGNIQRSLHGVLQGLI